MKKLQLLAVLAMLPGCDSILPNVVGALLVLLGITPLPGFSNPSSSEYGQMEMALSGVDPDTISVDVGGEEADVRDVSDTEGHPHGSFVMLVDGSGSLEKSPASECEGCPTDPERRRVDAVKALAFQLLSRAPDWRLAVMDFGGEAPTGGFNRTRLVQPYGTDLDQLSTAADGLASYGKTPLWDSVTEVLGSIDADAREHFDAADTTVGRGIVVLSDGMDTSSDGSLEMAIARAKELGIAVHVVGLGSAADVSAHVSAEAVAALRRLASETGGFYGSVEQPDELPALFEKIADSLLDGFQKVTVTVANPPPAGEPVEGTVTLAGSGVSLPFRFTAP